jgi:hypothetical protein
MCSPHIPFQGVLAASHSHDITETEQHNLASTIEMGYVGRKETENLDADVARDGAIANNHRMWPKEQRPFNELILAVVASDKAFCKSLIKHVHPADAWNTE